MKHLLFLAIASAVLSNTTVAWAKEGSDEKSATHTKIVNGQLESGYPAVGGIHLKTNIPNYGDYESVICTGTLIAPDWVLTAAHCLDLESNFGIPRGDASGFGFYFGQKFPEGDGVVFQASEVYIHPSYRESIKLYDIGLMHLATPQTDFEPIDFNRESLENYIDHEVLSIGLGVTNPNNQDGYAIKHSLVEYIKKSTLTHVKTGVDNAGDCYGDSGGPILMTMNDGTQKVIAVHANISNANCLEDTFNTSTNYFANWIDVTMGRSGACDETSCDCPEACQDYGACDNRMCNELQQCSAALNGFSNNGQIDAVLQSYEDSTANALELIGIYLDCYEQCSLFETNFTIQQCIYQKCSTDYIRCEIDEAPHGNAGCASSYEKLQSANWQFEDFSLFVEPAEEESEKLLNVYQCVVTNGCTTSSNSENCITQNCSHELNECMPFAGCSLLGGDCPEGYSCIPTLQSSYCAKTEGKSEGTSCNPNKIECQDGFLCAPELNVCVKACDGNAQCESRVCDFSTMRTLGVGFCHLVEIEPDASVPDAGELTVDANITSDDDSKPSIDSGVSTNPDAGQSVDDSKDSGCSTSPRNGSSLPLWLLALPLLSLRRRRA